MLKIKNIAIFASGNGSNAENIIKYFENTATGKVKTVLCNVPNAYVLTRANALGVHSAVFSRDEFYNSDKIINILQHKQIDFIVLAGFLWLIPESIIKFYSNKIVNIHPALLPNYGGRGMYGNNVHKAVIADKNKESGITVHYVNEKYDDGSIIFQAKCEISETDTPETLAQKIHALEYRYFPEIIESLLMKL
ncbi:MAG: phosphoribosylglycinamide formyltransferase [Prevotellaceae bacterium]|jgi:phosphoribosylglycinamide formyltransferase-1|nr:phosphoribosylglycinamide formyltransferase [Prevotellaceae bacterium]